MIQTNELFCFRLQGETPKQRAEKANDQELADYLENRQHYQMIQREDQETAVWSPPRPSQTVRVSSDLSFIYSSLPQKAATVDSADGDISDEALFK